MFPHVDHDRLSMFLVILVSSSSIVIVIIVVVTQCDLCDQMIDSPLS